MFALYLFSIVFTSLCLFFRSGKPRHQNPKRIRRSLQVPAVPSPEVIDLFISDLFDDVSADAQQPSESERVEDPKDRYDLMTEEAIRVEAKDRKISRVGVKGIKRLKDELRTQDFKNRLVAVSL